MVLYKLFNTLWVSLCEVTSSLYIWQVTRQKNACQECGLTWSLHTLIKKKRKLSSYIRKFKVEQLQSHIWGRASSYMRKCAIISPYLRRPLVIYDFATAPLWISLYMRKFLFSFLSVHGLTWSLQYTLYVHMWMTRSVWSRISHCWAIRAAGRAVFTHDHAAKLAIHL